MEFSMTGSQKSILGNFKDSMKKCKPRFLNERLTKSHWVLGSTAPPYASASEALEIVYKEQQDFYVGCDGGYTGLIHSKIGQETIIHLESSFLNFYLKREVKSEEIHSVDEAEQCLEKENRQSGNEHGRAHRL